MESGRISFETERVKIDARDKKILSALSSDSRMPASDIAKRVLLSRDAVSYRINRLKREGVILGFVPQIHLSAFGYRVYHVFMLLDEKKHAKHESLIKFLHAHQNTLSLMSYTDTWDVEWVMAARSLKEFDALFSDMLTSFSDVILELEKMAVIRAYSLSHAPASLTGKESAWPSGKGPAEMDEKDKKVLKELCGDCRQSSYEISRKAGMSPDSVVYRINRLKQQGIIASFTAVLNLSRLGHSWYTYAIRFGRFDRHDEKKFIQFVLTHPHIVRAVRVFGPWDVLLSIATDSPRDYHTTVKQIKNTFADNVSHYQTWLANEEYMVTAVPKAVFGGLRR